MRRDWPPALKQQPLELADAGFYYIGKLSTVKIFFDSLIARGCPFSINDHHVHCAICCTQVCRTRWSASTVTGVCATGSQRTTHGSSTPGQSQSMLRIQIRLDLIPWGSVSNQDPCWIRTVSGTGIRWKSGAGSARYSEYGSGPRSRYSENKKHIKWPRIRNTAQFHVKRLYFSPRFFWKSYFSPPPSGSKM